MNVVYRKRTTAVMTIPDDHFTGTRGENTLDRCVQLTNQQSVGFLKTPLSWQQLFVGVVDSADTFHVGDDQNSGSVRGLQAAREQQDEKKYVHYLRPPGETIG